MARQKKEERRSAQVKNIRASNVSSQTGSPPTQADLERQMLDVNRAIAGNPQDWKAYRDRGWIYAHKHEFDRALADLEWLCGLSRMMPVLTPDADISGRPPGRYRRRSSITKRQCGSTLRMRTPIGT